MNLANLEQRLIAAARQTRPSEQVPLAFEKRVMALLKSSTPLDDWALWGRALWRAAGACLAVMLLLGAFALLAPRKSIPASQGDLSQEFENTLLAGVNQDTDVSR